MDNGGLLRQGVGMKICGALKGWMWGWMLILFLGGSGLVLAQEEAQPTPNPETVEPRERIDAFFQLLSRDRVEVAYAGLIKGSIIEERAEDVEALKNRTQHALDAYGAIRSYDVLQETSVGSSLRRYTCLSLNEDLPLRWRFYFYRSGRGWKLVDLRVDDGLVELFDELGQPAR
jgi:hypothetical protein